MKRCEAEGEFMLLNGGNNLRLFEFSLTDGTSFEFQQSNELRDAYSIVYAEFTDFSFTNLAPPKFSKKTIECHHCKTINHIKTWPYAQSYGCMGCDSRYALDKNGNLIPIEDNKTNGQFDLELNQTGTLFGIDYQIIGMALKQERTIYKSKWKEYTLFNNQYGYAFLSEYNGHWIFVQEKGSCPTLLETVSNSFEYGGELFDLYNDYHFDVLDARGEFPYNIFDDEDIRVKEYISPPQMWIFEKSRDEGYNWYNAKHIGKHEMQTFQKPLPYKSGVGAIEPKGSIDLKTLKITAALVIAFALLIHLFTANLNKQEILLDRGFSTTDSATSINFVSEKFTLNKWKSNLSFELSAPVQNSWLSLDINLVNAKTGDEYALDQGVEYYSGYEGGESWSEGSQTSTEYLSSIPSGTYYLNIHSSADTYNRVNDFHLTVTNDVEMTRNLVIIIILLSITPLGYYFYRRYAETSRWANSDFSPYTTTI